MAKRNEDGRWGEAVAADYLRRKGYRILEANFRSRYGEIDLIAENRQFLVFVEVKLRKNDHFAQAMEYVTYAKQNRIKTTALYWLGGHSNPRQVRFDVIEVYAPQGAQTARPDVRHWEDAFE